MVESIGKDALGGGRGKGERIGHIKDVTYKELLDIFEDAITNGIDPPKDILEGLRKIMPEVEYLGQAPVHGMMMTPRKIMTLVGKMKKDKHHDFINIDHGEGEAFFIYRVPKGKYRIPEDFKADISEMEDVAHP